MDTESTSPHSNKVPRDLIYGLNPFPYCRLPNAFEPKEEIFSAISSFSEYWNKILKTPNEKLYHLRILIKMCSNIGDTYIDAMFCSYLQTNSKEENSMEISDKSSNNLEKCNSSLTSKDNKSANESFIADHKDLLISKNPKIDSTHNRASYAGPDLGNNTCVIPIYEVIPPVGLQNIGNTCYMNSILQVFMHYHEYFIQDLQSTDPVSSSLKSLLELMKLSASLEIERNLRIFKRNLGNICSEYQSSDQMDAKAFYLSILDTLKAENKRSSSTFMGNTVLDFICKAGNHNTSAANEYGLINLGIIGGIGSVIVQKHINEHFKSEELLQNKDSFYCTKCEQVVEGKLTLRSALPKVLCIYIDNQNSPELMIKENKELKVKNQNYNLECIIIRESTFHQRSFGHFLALRKIENNWVLFNDSVVSIYQQAYVRSAYLLFYSISK